MKSEIDIDKWLKSLGKLTVAKINQLTDEISAQCPTASPFELHLYTKMGQALVDEINSGRVTK